MTGPLRVGICGASRAISRYGSAGANLNRACIHVYPAPAAASPPISAAGAVIVATPTPSAPKCPRKTATPVAYATWYNVDDVESTGHPECTRQSKRMYHGDSATQYSVPDGVSPYEYL